MLNQLSKLAIVTGTASAVLLSLSGNANATFTFTSNVLGSSPKGDILLQSVVLDSTGELVSDFSFVNGAAIVANDQYTGGNSGAASADIGDNATTGVKVENATAADIVTNLGNNNLNNIIDTEDTGKFQIDLTFAHVIDNLLVWERGNDNDAWGAGNSDLAIQALDAQGNLIGNYLKITRNQWKNAGFSIDTKEIGGAQEVGSLGVSIASDLGVEGGVARLRFFSETGFNGPDWKFVGTNAARNETTDVPEPGLLLGLGLLGGAAFIKRQVLSH